MPNRTSLTGSELFIVDNSDTDPKVLKYLHDWCEISNAIDIATGCFEIGSLLALRDEWQKVDKIRVLMGDKVSKRTKNAFVEAVGRATKKLDDSLEAEKGRMGFSTGFRLPERPTGTPLFERLVHEAIQQDPIFSKEDGVFIFEQENRIDILFGLDLLF
jgi:hypothetical protein